MAALVLLGRAELHVHAFAESTAHLQRAAEIRRGLGDRRGGRAILLDLAIAAQLEGEPETARVRLERCIELAEQDGDLAQVSVMLFNLGDLYTDLDRWEDARRCLHRSAEIRRARADAAGLGPTLAVLGTVTAYQGRFAEALAAFDEALPRHRQPRRRVAHRRGLLGGAAPAPRGHAAARDAKQALALAVDQHDRTREAVALRQLAKVARRRADQSATDHAVERARAAFAVFDRPDPMLERSFNPAARMRHGARWSTRWRPSTTRARVSRKTGY